MRSGNRSLKLRSEGSKWRFDVVHQTVHSGGQLLNSEGCTLQRSDGFHKSTYRLAGVVSDAHRTAHHVEWTLEKTENVEVLLISTSHEGRLIQCNRSGRTAVRSVWLWSVHGAGLGKFLYEFFQRLGAMVRRRSRRPWLHANCASYC